MKPSRPKNLRETYAETDRAMSHLAKLTGKPVVKVTPEMKPKRERKASVPSVIPTEHEEQSNFVEWFRQQYKGVRLFAIPNAAKRSVELAAYLKREGFSAGVPDIFIPAWKIFIEFKRQKGGTVSDEQHEWLLYLQSVGYNCHVSYGCEDAMQFCKRFVQSEGI